MAKETSVKRCGRCKGAKSKVIDVWERSGSVRRRRECPACGRRWTTVEIFRYEYDRLTDVEKQVRKLKTP